MARHFAAESSNGFDEFWSGEGSAGNLAAAEYSRDLVTLIPESVAADPEWAELAAYGIGYREAAALALPELAELEDDEIDDELADIISEMTEEQMEGFFDFLKNTARGALRVAAPLAGTAGRIVGTAIGGPIGTMVGGMAGDLLGRGAQALDRQLGRTPQRGRRRGGGRRRRGRRGGGFGQAISRFAPSVHSGARAMVRAAGPAVNRLGQQLQDPAAGAALGQAAGQQIAHVAGRLSGIINSQEMQLALSNAAAGLPADIANAEGAIADASLLTTALREAIMEAADILETIQVAEQAPIGSGELAEFVGA